jgi:hypothetical protein
MEDAIFYSLFAVYSLFLFLSYTDERIEDAIFLLDVEWLVELLRETPGPSPHLCVKVFFFDLFLAQGDT